VVLVSPLVGHGCSIEAALIDRIASHCRRIDILQDDIPTVAPNKIVVTGADTGPTAGRSRIRTLGPPQADDLSEIALSFVELTYSDGICGAESPEPLGSISRQLQPKVLLEEDDCQYSQAILER
jgi:hypothetical protein